MKKKLSLFLAILFLMVTIFTGCANNKSSVSAGNENNTKVTETAAPTPAVIKEQGSESTADTANASTVKVTSTQDNKTQNNKSNVKEASVTALNSPKIVSAKPYVKNTIKITDAIKGASEYVKKASEKVNFKINDWDAIALRSSGYDINAKEYKINNRGYIDYKAESFIKENVNYYLTDYARTYLGIIASGYDPSNFMGVNLSDIIKNSTSKNGKFLDTVNGGEDLLNCHVWSMIALEAGKVNYDRGAALKYIEAHQNKDGGFYIFTAFPQSDVDFTAMTVMALTMAGRDKSSNSVAKALDYLKKQSQLLSKSANGETAETLSVIIQAVAASGDNVNKYTANGKNIVDELLSFYNTDGSFRHLKSGSGNAISTRQALIALISYKNNKNIYSNLPYNKGNFYNSGSEKVTSMKMHRAEYVSATGTAYISAAVTDADNVLIDISDGVNSYSEKATPQNGFINIEKAIPASNYSMILKTVKNGSITSVVKDNIENINTQVGTYVRVEGYDNTIVKSSLITAGNKKVYDYDGSSFTTSILSAYTFVMRALIENSISSSTSYSFGAPYIAGINSTFGGKFGGWDGWMYYINGKDPGVAMSDGKIADGDEILVYYGDWGTRPLQISGPADGSKNECVSVRVSCDGKSVEGACVYADGKKYITDSSGAAFISVPETGLYEIYAEKNDESGKPLFIRSKRISITIK